jgi:hypothetical protein
MIYFSGLSSITRLTLINYDIASLVQTQDGSEANVPFTAWQWMLPYNSSGTIINPSMTLINTANLLTLGDTPLEDATVMDTFMVVDAPLLQLGFTDWLLTNISDLIIIRVCISEASCHLLTLVCMISFVIVVFALWRIVHLYYHSRIFRTEWMVQG